MSFPGDPSSIRRWVEEKLLHPRQASAPPPWTLFLGGPMVGRWGTFLAFRYHCPLYCKMRPPIVCRPGPYDQVHDGPLAGRGCVAFVPTVRVRSQGDKHRWLKAQGIRLETTVLQEDVAQGSPSQRQRETRGLDKNKCVLEGRRAGTLEGAGLRGSQLRRSPGGDAAPFPWDSNRLCLSSR